MKNKRIILIVSILLISTLIGVFLYTQYFLKPEFNVFDVESPTKFNIQNIGKADAHNVKIKVNGTWIPAFKMNVASVENGSMYGTPATVFYGTIYNSSRWYDLARRIVPSIVGGETDGTTFLKLTVSENGAFRHLTDGEVASLINAFENPRAYYAFGETIIDILRVGEIRTVHVTLEYSQPSQFHEISISCDEGITSQFTIP